MNTESFDATMIQFLSMAAEPFGGSLTLVHEGVTLTARRAIWLAARKELVVFGDSFLPFGDRADVTAIQTTITDAGREVLAALYDAA